MIIWVYYILVVHLSFCQYIKLDINFNVNVIINIKASNVHYNSDKYLANSIPKYWSVHRANRADSIRASAEDLHKYGRPTKYSRWSLSEKQQYWHKLIRQRVKIVFKKIRNGSVANQPQEKNWQSKIGLNLGEFVVSLLYFQLSFFSVHIDHINAR